MTQQTIFKAVTALLLIYVALSELGATGSYLKALATGSTCFVFWWLGAKSAQGAKP